MSNPASSRDEAGKIVGINHVDGVISVATVGDSGMKLHNVPWVVEKNGPRALYLNLDREAAYIESASDVAGEAAFDPAAHDEHGDIPDYVFEAAESYVKDVQPDLLASSLPSSTSAVDVA